MTWEEQQALWDLVSKAIALNPSLAQTQEWTTFCTRFSGWALNYRRNNPQMELPL
jgi:hypothetical protein